ncbi:MAG: hypothetical protein M1296_01410 [Chloroflexi bacterium]|nr:hypothetical protein [Chloroflexota bacterium]
MDSEEYAQFGQLILLEHVRAGRLALAGVLASIPVAALVVGVGMVTERPAADSAALAVLLLITGAIGAKAYQRAQLRWRRGDLAAAAVWWLAACGSLAVAVRPIPGLLPLAFVGLPLALLVEMAWRFCFRITLRRISGASLERLVHESLREHYADDWRAYQQRLVADLREAQRLRSGGQHEHHDAP